jgi:hypothetical protein
MRTPTAVNAYRLVRSARPAIDRPRIATRQVKGHHQILVIGCTGTTHDGTAAAHASESSRTEGSRAALLADILDVLHGASPATLQPKQLTSGQRDHDDGEAAQQGERGQVARPPPVARRRADSHPDRGQAWQITAIGWQPLTLVASSFGRTRLSTWLPGPSVPGELPGASTSSSSASRSATEPPGQPGLPTGIRRCPVTVNAMPEDHEMVLAPLDEKVDHVRGAPARSWARRPCSSTVSSIAAATTRPPCWPRWPHTGEASPGKARTSTRANERAGPARGALQLRADGTGPARGAGPTWR